MNLKTIVMLLLSIPLLNCGGKRENSEDGTAETGVYSAIFLDVNTTKITPSIDPNVARETKKFSNINLTSADQFWGDKKMYFMHGLGGIDIKEEGEYFFRLTSAGKIKLQLNNVDLIVANDLHDKSTADGRRVLPAGVSVFDFEYYVGKYDPYLVLEWSRDGENFELIPDEVYTGTMDLKPAPYDAITQEKPLIAISEQEIADGWRLLFDGETLNGWHTYNKPGTIGSKWQVQDGALAMTGYGDYFLTYYIDGTRFYHSSMGGIGIVTDEAFENFELALEWKISKDGNSGLFYTVQEIPEYDEPWKSSPEMQMMDNQGHKDGLIYRHRTGDLYDLIASNEPRARAAGEWNEVMIIKEKGKIQHWLNGTLVLRYDVNSPEWNQMILDSKFAEYAENFAQAGPGKIGLQDHDDPVWFRNIKIRVLE